MTKIDGNINFIEDEWSRTDCEWCGKFSGIEDRLCAGCREIEAREEEEEVVVQ